MATRSKPMPTSASLSRRSRQGGIARSTRRRCEHLEEIARINEEDDALAKDMPKPEDATAEDIAEVVRRINERLEARPKDKDLKRAKSLRERLYVPHAAL